MRYFSLLFILLPVFSFADPNYEDEAKRFAKSSLSTTKESIKGFSREEISFKGDSEPFDPKSARESMLKGKDFNSSSKTFMLDPKVRENSSKNRLIDDQEAFIRSSEQISQHANRGESLSILLENEKSSHTCQKPGNTYPVVIKRSLHANVQDIKEKRMTFKVCQGHRKEETRYHRKDADNRANKYRDLFSMSEDVESNFSVQVNKGSRYEIISEWRHKENSPNCDNYKEVERVVRKAQKKELEDTWNYSNHNYSTVSSDPNCSLSRKVCLEGPATRKVNGKPIHRKCWSEELSFLCTPKGQNTCSFLKARNCQLMKQKCLRENFGYCTQWERVFECQRQKGVKAKLELPDYGKPKEDQESKNSSFSEVAARLSILKELEGETKRDTLDAKDVKYFAGKKLSCSKSLASKVVYDCCFAYSGLAKKAGLAKCNADELHLAELREKKSCRYVGKYEEKKAGIKIKDHHSYCCFGSKLSKIIQEQGRDQLGLGWGSPKNPDCRGLNYDELSKIDLSKIDVSELLEDFHKKNSASFDKKVQEFRSSVNSIKHKLKDRWKDVS